MDMRRLIVLVEAHDISNLAIADVLDGIKPRYARTFEIADYIEIAGTFETAEAFADRLVEPSSPKADLAREVLKAEWEAWGQHRGRTAPNNNDPFGNAPPLARYIASAIGASSYKKTIEVPWPSAGMMFSPEAYVLETPLGRLFLDAVEGPEYSILGNPTGRRMIYLSQIAAESTGGGLGTKAMEAIRQYAEQKHLTVKIFKVTNPKFFQRFSWLKPDGSNAFVFKVNE